MNTTQPLTFNFENLNTDVDLALNEALVAAQHGATVTIAVTYHKVTKTKARVAGVDYRPLLGAEKTTLIGVVKKVAIGQNGPYILLDATLTRAALKSDGTVSNGPAWTAIKPKGVLQAQVVSVVPAPAPAEAPSA